MSRIWLLLSLLTLRLSAQPDGAEVFEKKIRPVLATKCYGCHSSKLKTPMGGLVLDTKAGLSKGGASGPVVVGGKPSASRLITALHYTDPQLQMPPTGKLTDPVIADFERWIAAGALDPRVDAAAPAPVAAKQDRIEKGRQWWAFQPVRELPAPKLKNAAWPTTKIDSFVEAKLEQNGLKPSAPADRRTLIRRATVDLIGLAPSYEEVEAFTADTSRDSYQKLIERLLASMHYGERWGRYWLDVARYAEDNPTSEATNLPYPYAWRYRDWVIEAVNKDLPYDRFVKLQLAADDMPGVKRDDLRALGYLGAAPIYHKDARLSKDVIETLASDDWDERVDAVSRGLLGMTVACARCHDHKFDPILTKDYYAMAGVFASTTAIARPLRGDMDPEIEKRFLWVEKRLIDLDYLSKLMTNEPGTKPEEAKIKAAKFKAEMETLKAEMDPVLAPYPELQKYVAKFGAPGPTNASKKREPSDPNAPFMNAVYDAGMWVDGSDPDLTAIDYRAGKARDLPVFLRGSPSTPGEMAPRRFITVLSKPADGTFRHGSGRLDLADGIFNDASPLAARVIVNRVWGWHFGQPLVGTPSDFGTQGEPPSHPELLDDLSARFIAHGWSLKWLHREIMLSSAYRQASRPRADAEQVDATNRLVWRMNPRRLDIEAFRDTILEAAGTLNDSEFGPSVDLDKEDHTRRTVYAKVSRGRLNTLLRLYDFADPSQHSPGRDLTTTPLQQLFVLNSPFLQEQAAALAKRVETEPDEPAKVRALYRLSLARDASPKDVDRALSYMGTGATLAEYAQALLSTNEFIFWP